MFITNLFNFTLSQINWNSVKFDEIHVIKRERKKNIGEREKKKNFFFYYIEKKKKIYYNEKEIYIFFFKFNSLYSFMKSLIHKNI